MCDYNKMVAELQEFIDARMSPMSFRAQEFIDDLRQRMRPGCQLQLTEAQEQWLERLYEEHVEG